MPIWNRCQNCGRLIAYADFAEGRAVHQILTPSSEFTDERYETYHVACEAATAPSPVTTNGEASSNV
jgi:hypothetical protein